MLGRTRDLFILGKLRSPERGHKVQTAWNADWKWASLLGFKPCLHLRPYRVLCLCTMFRALCNNI